MNHTRPFTLILILLLGAILLLPAAGHTSAAPPRQEHPHWHELLRMSRGTVRDLAYSPDGSLLAVAGDGGVRLCTPDLDMLGVIADNYHNPVWAVAWSPDGTQLITGHQVPYAKPQPALRLWDVATGKQLYTLGSIENGGDDVYAVAWSPDGEWVAVVTYNGLQLWDVSARSLVATPETEPMMGKLAWSPDSTILATPHTFWDTATWEPIREFEGWNVQWSPDGARIAAAGPDNTLTVWDATTLERLTTMSGHDDWPVSLAWSPDGSRLVSGSYDGTARIWDAESGAELTVLPHADRVYAVAWSPDGRYVVSGTYNNFDVLASPAAMAIQWDVTTGEQVEILAGAGYTESIIWSPDSTRLASAEAQWIKIWDGHTGKLLRTLGEPGAAMYRIRWSPDGRLLAAQGFGRNQVMIWDTATGELLTTLDAPNRQLRTAVGGSWSPDSTRYVHGGEDNALVIYDARSGEPLLDLIGHDDLGWMEVEWSPDGTHIASAPLIGEDTTVHIWDAASGEQIAVVEGGSPVRWSPDGSRLAYRTDEDVVLYDIATGTQMTLPTPASIFAWSPNGAQLATWWSTSCAQRAQVQLWDTHSGARLMVLDGGVEAWIDLVRWSPYGINRGTCGGPYYLAYAPDGTRWAIGHGNGISVWAHEGTILPAEE